MGGARSGLRGTAGLGAGASVWPGPVRRALLVSGRGTRADALDDPGHGNSGHAGSGAAQGRGWPGHQE